MQGGALTVAPGAGHQHRKGTEARTQTLWKQVTTESLEHLWSNWTGKHHRNISKLVALYAGVLILSSWLAIYLN